MAGPPTVETESLVLRAPLPEDAAPLFEIQGDPDAMRFTYCAPTARDTAKHLRAYAARFEQDGFAPWTAVHRVDGCVVGWGGLNRDPAAPKWGTEVSYFVHRNYWGQGLAGEIVAASLSHAFEDLVLPQVGAFTHPRNRASARVLLRAGFQPVGYVEELDRDQYSIRADAW